MNVVKFNKATTTSGLECAACGATSVAACDCGVPYLQNGAQKREVVVDLLKANPNKTDRQIGKAAGVDHKTVAVVRHDLESYGEIPHKKEREEEGGRKARGRKPAAKPRKPKATRPKAAHTDQVNEMVHRPTEFTQRYIEQLDAWLDGDPQLSEEAVMTLSNALHLCAEEFERMAKFVKAHPTKGGQ